MATLPKEYKNKAIVQLKKLGWTFYAIQQALEMKDKRNLLRVWERDKDKYDFELVRILPTLKKLEPTKKYILLADDPTDFIGIDLPKNITCCVMKGIEIKEKKVGTTNN